MEATGTGTNDSFVYLSGRGLNSNGPDGIGNAWVRWQRSPPQDSPTVSVGYWDIYGVWKYVSAAEAFSGGDIYIDVAARGGYMTGGQTTTLDAISKAYSFAEVIGVVSSKSAYTSAYGSITADTVAVPLN